MLFSNVVALDDSFKEEGAGLEPFHAGSDYYRWPSLIHLRHQCRRAVLPCFSPPCIKQHPRRPLSNLRDQVRWHIVLPMRIHFSRFMGWAACGRN